MSRSVFNVLFIAVIFLASSEWSLLTSDQEIFSSHEIKCKTNLSGSSVLFNSSVAVYLCNVAVVAKKNLLPLYVTSSRHPHMSKCKIMRCAWFISLPLEAAFVFYESTKTEQSGFYILSFHFIP